MSIKCAIGATIGVALVIAAIIASTLGIRWLIVNCELLRYVFAVVVVVLLLVSIAGIWKSLYDRCVAKRKELGL